MTGGDKIQLQATAGVATVSPATGHLGDDRLRALSETLLAVYDVAERRISFQSCCHRLSDHFEAPIALVRLTGTGARDSVLARADRHGSRDFSPASLLRSLRRHGPSPGAGLARTVAMEADVAGGAVPLWVGLAAETADSRFLFCVWTGPDSATPETLSLILPHLCRALALRKASDELWARALLKASVLNRVPSSFIALGTEGRILFTNDEAAIILDKAGPVARQKSSLIVADPALRSALDKSLAELDTIDDPSRLEVRSVQVRAPQPDAPAYLVTALPVVLHGEESCLLSNQRILMVVLTSSIPQRLPGNRALRESFGMTPAEARVCRELCHAADMESAARALGISVPTAKTHLGRVYHKLGVSSRTGLLQRLRGHYWVERPIVINFDPE